MGALMQKQIDQIGRSHHLDFIILHGSVATGKSVNPNPDTDIAIYRKGGIDPKEYMELHSEFYNIFGNALDLKTLHKKNPLFRYHVVKDGKLLYGNQQNYNSFVLSVMKSYQDTVPLRKNMEQMLYRNQKKLHQLYAR